MHELGKALMLFGAVLIVVGLLLLILPKVPFLGKFPDDIVVKRENFTFSFPLATSIVISIVVSLFLYLLKLPAVPTCRDRESSILKDVPIS